MSTFPGKKFDEMTLIEQLRNNLSPQGTEPVVALRLFALYMRIHRPWATKHPNHGLVQDMFAGMHGLVV